MAEAFRRDRKGRIVCRVEPEERAILQQLLGEISALLTRDDLPKATDLDPLIHELGLADLVCRHTAEPDDPVLRRLLPSGYADDESAAELRRYTDTSLRAAKIADAEAMKTALEALTSGRERVIVIDRTQAVAWLRAINDLRLALGVRLNVTAESTWDLEATSDEGDAVPAALYDFLTWWQDSLVRVLLPD